MASLEFIGPATRFSRRGAGEVFAGGVVQFCVEDAGDTCLPVLHVDIGPLGSHSIIVSRLR